MGMAIKLVRRMGNAPTRIVWLKASCPSVVASDALITKLVLPVGLEPTTVSLEASCSIQLRLWEHEIKSVLYRANAVPAKHASISEKLDILIY